MSVWAIIGKSVRLYLLACVVAIGLGIVVFMFIYADPASRSAVWMSAAVALVVQGLAFGVARLMATQGHGVAGWGLGAAVCIVALVIFGFVSRALGLPPNAALLSLATFFFLTELIEPPLLNV